MSSTLSNPLPPLELFILLNGAHADRYIIVAGTAIFVYDYLLTLPDEIRLIWRRKRNLSFFLFVLCRYTAFVDSVGLALASQFAPNPSSSTCAFLTVTRLWLNIFAISIGEAILLLRTRAIWDNSRMTAALILFYISATIAPCVFALRASRGITYLKGTAVPVQPGCIPIWTLEVAVELWFSYIIVAFWEAVIMFLTVWKSIRGRDLLQSAVFRRIYRDGILFYVGYFALSAVIIGVLPVPQTLEAPKQSFLVIYRVLYTVLSTRLLLNIREAASCGTARVPTTNEFRSELVFTTQGNSLDSDMVNGE